MTKNDSWTHYEQRLTRVTAYIYDHLDDTLDLNKLAEVACLSPYHWNRIYHALYGETVAATVKRLRLHRAAGYLAQTGLPIEVIAEKSGYKTVQSFTRVFRDAFGMPPALYRKNGSHTLFQPAHNERMAEMYDVTIKQVPGFSALTIEHSGPYMQIGQAFDRLIGWCGANDLIDGDLRMIGIYYDDPNVVPENQLRSRAGIVPGGSLPSDAPFERTQVAGGSYAALRHKGPYADMRAAYQWLYGQWLLPSGHQAADAPCFEEYLNNPRDTAPTELLTDICLPLRIDPR